MRYYNVCNFDLTVYHLVELSRISLAELDILGALKNFCGASSAKLVDTGHSNLCGDAVEKLKTLEL